MQLRAMVESGHEFREEAAEVATILAAGLQRLLARKSSQISASNEENPLDCERVFEGHVRENRKELAL